MRHIKSIIALFVLVFVFVAYGAGPTSTDHVRSPVEKSKGAPRSFGSGLTKSSYGYNSYTARSTTGAGFSKDRYSFNSRSRNSVASDRYRRSSLLRKSTIDSHPKAYNLKDMYIPSRASKNNRRSDLSMIDSKPLQGISLELVRPPYLTDEPSDTSYDNLFNGGTSRLDRDPARQMSLLRLEEQLDYSIDQSYLLKSEELNKQSDDEASIDNAVKPGEVVEPVDTKDNSETKKFDSLEDGLDVSPSDGTEAPIDITRDQTAQEKADQLEAARKSAQIHTNALLLLGDFKSYEEFAKAKVDHYNKKAESFIKQGKFVEADSSYRLAWVYAGDDDDLFIKRAHVLLAAGDYMTSVYYLERAIKTDPSLAGKEIDLAAFIGDKYQQRIDDLKKRYDFNRSPELALLMAYVYNQADQTEEAQKAIQAAKDTVAGSGSVEAIRNAIEPAAVK